MVIVILSEAKNLWLSSFCQRWNDNQRCFALLNMTGWGVGCPANELPIIDSAGI
jgi:hypothetical protein